MVTKNKLIDTFATAIATMEGFFNASLTLARKNNNPGNIRAWGDIPIQNGFAHFPTEQAGWAALRRQVDKNLFTRKLTLREFFGGSVAKKYSGYAPSTDGNNPKKYAEFVWKVLAAEHPELAKFGAISGIDTILCHYPYSPEPTEPLKK